MKDAVPSLGKPVKSDTEGGAKPALVNGGNLPTTGPTQFPEVTTDPLRQAFESGRSPYPAVISTRSYEAQKARLQDELLKVQIWAQDSKQKFVVLFERRDVAGKGGTIKRFMEHLNPRYARIVALTKPSEKENGQWYFQRYIEQRQQAK